MHRSNNLLTFHSGAISFKGWFLLISSGLIASYLLPEFVHCIPLSPQSVSSHLISFQFISSHVPSSQGFSPHLTSPHLISSYLMFLSFWQPFSTVPISSHVIRVFLSPSFLSALHHSSHVKSSQLIPSQLISTLLEFSQLFSPHLRSSQFTRSSPFFLGQNLLRNRISAHLGTKSKKVRVWSLCIFVKTNLRGKWKAAKNEKSAKTHCRNPAASTWIFPQKLKVEDVKTKLS